MRLKHSLFLAVAVVLLAFFALTPSARAISISPITFDLSANPGDSIRNVIRIYNDQPSQVLVTVDVEDFAPSGELGQVVINDVSNETYSLKSWVTMDPVQFLIEPLSFRTIEFVVSVPLSAEPGGHYGSILFSTGSSGATSGGVGVTQKVAALILLNVSGDVTEKMYVAEFSAPSFSEYGPVMLTARFKNDGTVHLKPRGFITIKDAFGRERGKIDLPQYNVLPGMIRKIEIPWGEKYQFGRFSARLSVIYGSNNEPLSAMTLFWVVAWKIVSVIGLIVIFILWILIRGRRRLKAALRILAKGE